MAIYDVTGPDGKQYEVEGPPGASQAEVLARVQMHRATAPKPSRGFVAKANQALSAANKFVDAPFGAVNEALLGGVEGLYNMGAALGDPITRRVVGEDAFAAARAQRQRAADAVSGTFSDRPNPVARFVGQVGATLPFGTLKVGGKVAQYAPRVAKIATRAMQGGLGGAAVRDVGGDDAGLNMGIGAAANVVLPPAIGALVSRIGTSRPAQAISDFAAPYVRKAVGAVDDMAGGLLGGGAPRAAPLPARVSPPKVKPPVQEAFGRQAQGRLDTFRKIGINEPTTGMVTRDPAIWTYERNTSKLAGLGEDLVAQFQKVNDGLDAAAAKLVAKRGGTLDPEAVGKTVEEVLAAKQKEMQTATGALYKAVREQRGDNAGGALDGFLAKMDEPDFVDNSTMDAMRGDIMRRLQRFGLAGKSGLPRKGAVITVKQAEDLRQFIGNLGNTAEPNVRRIRALLVNSLDDDIVAAVGDDAFKAARASAKARFEEFGKTFAGKLAEGGVTAEKVTKRILSGSNKDLRALRQSFETGTPEQIERGRAAWNDVGNQALDDLFGNARGLDGSLSAAKLSAAYKRDAAKLRELLSPEEFDQVTAIVQATKFSKTAVPFSAENFSNTSSGLANMFAGAPGGGAGPGRKVMSNVLQHAMAAGVGAAGGATFGVANLALAGGKAAAGQIAAAKAAEAAIARVEMAKSPEAAAAAFKIIQAKASRDAAFRAAVKRWQDGGFYSSFAALKPGPGR